MGVENRQSIQSPDRLKNRPEHVAVIGGGISGSITAYLLLQAGIKVTLIDPIDPLKSDNSPVCGGCGGLIQDQTIKLLHEIGLFPDTDNEYQVIRDKPSGYEVYFPKGQRLSLPLQKDKLMWSVYRGFGPKQAEDRKLGFDGWLHEQIKKVGSEDKLTFINQKVTQVELGVEGKAKIHLKDNIETIVDFVVDATGAKGNLNGNKKGAFEYIYPDGVKSMDGPEVRKSLSMEFAIDNDSNTNIKVVTNPDSGANVWFAAVIPKGKHSTLVLMGRKNVGPEDVKRFGEYLKNNGVKILPENIIDQIINNRAKLSGCVECFCNSSAIVIKPAQHYLVDMPGGAVKVGDQGPTKVYKDGIGGAVQAAILTAQGIIGADLIELQNNLAQVFPPNDYFYAEKVMQMNDLVLRIPGMSKLLEFIQKKNIPLLSHFMEVYMGHLLQGDIPYQKMLPLINNILSPFLQK